MNFLAKFIKKQKHMKQSFHARLQMEAHAQQEIDARLTALEIVAENQMRQKRLDDN